MNPTILALRAITATFMRKLLVGAGAIGAGVALLALILVIYLSNTVHLAWLLALIILIPLVILAIVIFTLAYVASAKMLPRSLNKDEKRLVTSFGGRLLALVERGRSHILFWWQSS